MQDNNNKQKQRRESNEARALYRNLMAAGFVSKNLGANDEDDFVQVYSDKVNRKKLYDAITSQTNYDLGAYDKFEYNLARGYAQGDKAMQTAARMEQSQPKTPWTQPPQKKQQPVLQKKTQPSVDLNNAGENLKMQPLYEVSKPTREIEQSKANFERFNELTEQHGEDKAIEIIKKETIKPLNERIRNLENEIRELEEARTNAANKEAARRRKDDSFFTNFVKGLVASESGAAAEMDIPDNNEIRYYRLALEEKKKELEHLREEERRQRGKQGGFSELFRGYGKVLSNPESYDIFGLSALSDAKTKLSAAQHSPYESKEEKAAREAMMNALFDNQEAQKQFKGNTSWLYEAGQMGAQSAFFFLEMLPATLNPAMAGINIGSKAAGKVAAKAFTKEALDAVVNKGAKQFIKSAAEKGIGAGAKAAGQIAGAYAIKAAGVTGDLMLKGGITNLTTSAANTASETIDRHLGDVNENREFYGAEDNSFASWLADAKEVVLDRSKEFGSEFGGKYLPKLGKLFMPKRVQDMLLTATPKGLKGAYDQMTKVLGKIGLGNITEEMGEEYYGQAIATLLNLDSAYGQIDLGNGETARGKNLFFTKDFNMMSTLGIALTTGGHQAIGMGYSAAGYASKKHQVNSADKAAGRAFGGEQSWNPIKQIIDNSTNEEMTNTMNALAKDQTLSNDQKAAALKYSMKSMEMRGWNLASVANSRDGNVSPEEAAANQAYLSGYNDENHANRHTATMDQAVAQAAAQREVFDQMDKEAADLQRKIELNPTLAVRDIQEDERLSQKEKETLYDYINTKQRYDGMMQAFADAAQEEVAQVNETIDNRTDKTYGEGRIRPATLKVDDRQVYITSGTVSTFENDGTVDAENSSKQIIVVDAQTGKKEAISPKDILSVEETIDPIEEKTKAKDEILNRYSEQVKAEFNGQITDFKEGLEFVIPAQDGIEEMVITIAPNQDGIIDNGDGTVNVMNEFGDMFSATKEDLQNIASYNAYQSAMQRREQALKERKSDAETESAEVESNGTGSQVKYNDLVELNENGERLEGRVVEVSEDGLTIELYQENEDGDQTPVGVRQFKPQELDEKLQTLNGKAVEKPQTEEQTYETEAVQGESTEQEVEAQPQEEEPQAVGNGIFGKIYNQFKGKVREAIEFLRSKQDGEVVGALYHKDIGDISLVWGNEKAGLKKILSKHPKVIDDLQGALDDMEIVEESENRIKLESPTHFAVVSKTAFGEPYNKWLLTAYEKKEASEPANSSMDVESNQNGKLDDTATQQSSDVSTSKDTTIQPNGEESAENIQEEQQPQPTALSRIPTNENGEPVYEQAESPDVAFDAIMEQTEGDEQMAVEVANDMVAIKNEQAKKLEKEQAKKVKAAGTTTNDLIAAKKETKKQRAEVEKIRQEAKFWENVASTPVRRQAEANAAAKRAEEEQRAAEQAERERMAAEQAERERQEREEVNGVPDITDDTPQDARARGFRRVNGYKAERQGNIDARQGKEVEVKFAKGVSAKGRVAVMDAAKLQPSHIRGQRNPLHFIDEAQPKERKDAASMTAAEEIARNIRPEEATSSTTAYTGAPSVNSRGEVIQGNNRAAAIKLMYDTQKEQAAKYKEYLKEHASDFGLSAEDIDAMENPVLVNVLDVADDKAIELGQYVAQDTESGGTERIKPKNTVMKMGAEMKSFANLLLNSSDEEASISALIDKNGAEVLQWMSRKGFITPTQYASAFTSKRYLTDEAKNDLKGIMYQSIFQNGNTHLEEMFATLPAKAQKAILATAFRDFDSAEADRMIGEIQASIRAYYALQQREDFAGAKSFEDVLKAVDNWSRQYNMDDATGESYLPATKFSNFALHLAAMYKGRTQTFLQDTFNQMYDLIQGTVAGTLFSEADTKKRTLAEAIREVLDIEYNGNNEQIGSDVLGNSSQESESGRRGSDRDLGSREQDTDKEQPIYNSRGTESDSGRGGNDSQRQDDLPQTIDVGTAERTEMETRIVEWLSDENLEKALGKSREQIFEEFGNEPMPIAYVPARFAKHISPDIKDPRIYCGKGYFIEHALRNHAGSGNQIPVEDVDVSKYLNIQNVLDNPDSIKETFVDGKRTVVFIKKIGRYFAELTQVEENGKIILHKSLFNQQKEPYAKKEDIRHIETFSEGGNSSISHTGDAVPAISLESRENVGSSDSKGTTKSQTNSKEENKNEQNYTIEPAQYTTKRGKVLDMQLVKFGEALTKEDARNAKALAKELRGWWDNKQGGFMMRSEEDAQRIVDAVMEDSKETLSDAAPISLQDVRKVNVESLTRELSDKGEAKLSDHSEAVKTEQKKNAGAFGLVSDERMDELKNRLRNKLNGQLNVGIDPEILAIGLELAAGHIDRGIKKFADFAKVMVSEIGDVVRPYLKAFYNGARDLPEVVENGLSKEMTPYDEVARFDVENFDKEHISTLDTAATIAAEQEKLQQAEQAKKELASKRNEERRKEKAKTDTPFKVGDKVMYKGKEATLYSIENDRPVLDVGLAPVMYEVTDWDKLSSVTQVSENKQTKKPSKKQKNVPLQTETADLFSGIIEEETLNTNEDEIQLRNGTGSSEREGRHESKQDEPLGKSTELQSERPDGRGMDRRDTTHSRSNEGRSGGVSGLSEGEQGLATKKNTHNNHSERGEDHAPISVDARIEANIKAIELAQQLTESGEKATKEQMETLRKFSGWGGLGKAFNEKATYSTPDGKTHYGEPTPENKRVRDLLGEEAYREAVMSANSSYYTPAYVIDTLWDIAQQIGFKGGKILEGSAGIGNILGQMPQSISERSDIRAIEIDGTTGSILSLLYPDAKVDIQGFEQTHIPNGSVDLAITNVPFVTGLRVNDTTGDKDISRKFHNIHDFCIAKNVRKLREGGIGIFITSNGTLDNSKKLRDWVVNEGGADFVGAFRMNNKTFGGTAVTSDIVVVRKRVNGQKSNNAIDVSTVAVERTVDYDTGETKKVKGKEEPLIKTLAMDYNKYFVEHPENMAGVMKFAFEQGDSFRPTSKGLYAEKGKNQKEMLANFVKSFNEEEFEKQTREERTIIDPIGGKVGEMFVKDGKLYINSTASAQLLPVNANKVKGHTKEECFSAYKTIKDALNEVLEYQTKYEDDKGLQPLISKLNGAYDEFVKTYGHFNKNTAISFLRNDVDYSNVASIETYKTLGDGKGGTMQIFDKADVMKQRVIQKEKEPTPTNVKDGVVASIFKFGRIDIPYISEQLGKSAEDVKIEIIESGYGFEDPISRQVELSYQYLSGNVREKLRQAQENNENGMYDRNIKALQEVVPMNIPAHLIDFTLGSSWISPKLYEEYIKERTDLDVKVMPTGGTWYLDTPYSIRNEKNRSMGVYSEKFNETIFGNTLIDAAMSNKTITVSHTNKKYDGTTETITDKDATQACAAKIDEIRQDFKDWARQKMQSNSVLSDEMERVYNDMFNNYVPISIPEDFAPKHFMGANSKFEMRPHQGKSIVRGTMQPLLLAHEVGTGKTFTLISTAMEMRRLGTARKPMIVVQNATVGQFVANAKELYPNAKILTLDEADRSAEGRKNFYAKIRYNDWDMIVIPQSTFDFIPDSDERERQFIQDKIDEKRAVLDSLIESVGDERSQIVKQAERELSKLEQEFADLLKKDEKKLEASYDKRRAISLNNAEVKAEEMLDRSTDDVETFDDMKIDALLIDEAHEYKHLGFETAMKRGVKGVDASYSKKSQGLYLKTKAVLENNNGKNVIFATGTPISNTAAEIWTFMRYLMPADTMKEYGIYYFDDFVRNFGNIQQMLEFTTSGKFKENNRFAGYVNLPELVRIWSGISDTVLTDEAEGVKDKIPEMEGGKAQDIYLPQTRALRSVMKYVKKELARYEEMSGKEKKANSHIPLTMYGIAKSAAVDARLVSSNAEDDPNSKTNEAVRQTLRSLKETDSYKGTVAIFADNYQNKKTGFNLYDDIRQKLIAEGVPADEIVVMRSGMSVNKKVEIFDKVNSGAIRVILGSTYTLGTGVNIQERLHTLIHLDAPNRPMDYTQRNGRILRQGNILKEMGKPVRILRFGVEDSLDVTAYQRLKTKGAIADSIMHGKEMLKNGMTNRVLEEEEDAFGDTVAQLSGSEYAMLKNNAEKNVRKFESRKKQWEADQTYIHNAKPRLKGQIAEAEKRAQENRKYLQDVEKAFPNGTAKSITAGKQTFASIKDMDDFFKEHNKNTLEKMKKMREGGEDAHTRELTVSLGGYDFKIRTVLTKELVGAAIGQLSFETHRKMTYSCEELGLKDEPVQQNLLRNAVEDIVQNVITGKDFAERAEVAENSANKLKSELKQIEAREGAAFEFEEDLKKARQQYDEYTELMKKEMEEKDAKYAEIDKTVDEASDIETSEDEDELFREGEFYNGMSSDEIYDALNEHSEYSSGAGNLMEALENYFGGEIESASRGARNAIERGLVPFNGGKYSGIDQEYHHIAFVDEEGNRKVEAVPFTTPEELRETTDIRFRSREESMQKTDIIESMRQQVEELAEKLHLDNVEIVESGKELSGNKARAKGFYDKKTGKITIVLSNNTDVEDAVKTLLHEAVAHHGLRELFGKDFDMFLDEVFQNADKEVRRKISDAAVKKYHLDFHKATEEYLASLAESMDFEQARKSGWWQKIKDFFVSMFEKLGVKGLKGTKLSDNDLRYILWKSYENLKSGGKNSILDVAADLSKQYELGVGAYENIPEVVNRRFNEEEDANVMFRDGSPEMHERTLARQRYELEMKSGMFQTQEALQDSMLSLKKAMLMIDKEHKYIEDIAGFENAYLGENRLSSVNKAEADAFARLLFKPMLNEVAKLAHNKEEREQLTDYMFAKHGLERNRLMRDRDGDNPNRYETDYAGLTALTGIDDVVDAEIEAQRMVDEYESKHNTQALWRRVNEVSSAILSKLYECGMMSKETYDKISSMYDYYIPLRGFDEKTSDDAYAYLSHKQSAFNAPFKKAEGRKSKADDPFAYLQAMAESAIIQGNRNKLVKQKFLNFVLNHPSDLVSVSELWIKYDDITDEWVPVFPDNIETDDSPEEVERKMQEFENRMRQLAKEHPDQYKRGKDAANIPYRVVGNSDLRQHQVIVKRDGRDYVLTINGNPRVAQALNGQTNPDNDISGVIGSILRLGERVNRQLSAFYTTRNPDFVMSNFVRDMLYSNTMVWVKEGLNYSLRFNKNYTIVNPVRFKYLLRMYRDRELDMNRPLEKMFYQFMMNGGETGYTSIRDIEKRKNDIQRELKKANGKLPISRAWDLLGEEFDDLNRAVENCARFAAFKTSIEMGRTIDRAIYDAKEISVNFNKKGSGAKFFGAQGQTKLGNVAAGVSGVGRSFYVFWNAAIQGTTNFGRQLKRHPVEALAAMAVMFAFGNLIAYIGGLGDDDDKNSYYNLPEHVRRSNILFRAGSYWISIPLPVEYRAIYGMGELAMSIANGKEHLTGAEIASAIAEQVSQILPIDFLEGGAVKLETISAETFVKSVAKSITPSAIKPIVEAYSNKSWTGLPIYKDTPFNKNLPEWTKAYPSANKYIKNLATTLNEATGGDEYTKGTIDINPARVEHMLNGYFGGVFGTIDKLVKTGETIIGEREFEPRNILLANRLVKAGDERTEYRAVNNEYFRLKDEHDDIKRRLNSYKKKTNNGIFDYAKKIDFIYNSPEYARYLIFEDYVKEINKYNKYLKDASDDEERKDIEAEFIDLKKDMIEDMNKTRKKRSKRNAQETENAR